MLIRNAESADDEAIDRILKAAFETDAEARLTQALRASGDVRLELVAEQNGIIYGTVLLSILVSPKSCLGLGPIAVLPEEQTKGIGNALMHESVALAKKQNWRGIFLLGNPAYYSRFGFSVETAAPFKSAFPAAYMQALFVGNDRPGDDETEMIYAKPFYDL